ncbi:MULTISPECIES: stage II sporulation protein M [unclassified Clostridium]|uniref:stage II sporulation protein M n=1 Tax=unclassified Clostridium TaxID=2614128 RepID=UPI00052DEF2A|nr:MULTISPECIES: stage II sporulation protein M [unclassified Clostridium]KGK89037.1 sporulation protein [Clostridium sp. HMP27]
MSRNNFVLGLNDHIKENFWLYVISLICIFTGMVLGVYTVKYMGEIYKTDLISYFQGFTEYLNTENLNYKGVFLNTIRSNIPFILFIWLLGMTMVGIPVILIIGIIKGYTLGFTISFIINSVGLKGIGIAIFGVIIQNIIYIPCMIIASVLAMEFSLNFLKERIDRRVKENIWIKMLSYSCSFLAIIAVMFVGFFMEAYIIPNILKIII